MKYSLIVKWRMLSLTHELITMNGQFSSYVVCVKTDHS